MKESDRVFQECQKVLLQLNECLRETGWKGRYLGYCSKLSTKYGKCKIELHNVKAREHNQAVREKGGHIFTSKGPQSEHHCVLVHSNKICLITLAPSHPIVKEKKKILKLDFQVTNKLDRLENKVRGKGKKGGQHIMPDSALCYVECEDNTRYTIWGCIKGKLVEINRLLLKNPNLIVEKTWSQGFLAIILPSIKDLDTYKNKLITQEKYENEVLSHSA